MDQGNTAFILIAAALVLLMTPGLAFFYGGLVKAKSVISMMMLSFGAMGLIGVLWVLYGYAIAFPRRPTALAVPLVDRPGRDRPAEPARDARGRRVPAARLRRVPGHVRDHHRRPRLGCDRRPRQVRRVDDLRRDLGDGRLLPGRQLGVQLRPRRRRQLRLRRLDHLRHAGVLRRRRDRLRRWHRGPHQRRCRGPRAGARPRQARRLPEGRARPAQPAVRPPRRRPAVVRLVRLQRRLGARGRQHRGARVRQHDRRSRRRAARLADRREDQGRQAHLGRRRIRVPSPVSSRSPPRVPR